MERSVKNLSLTYAKLVLNIFIDLRMSSDSYDVSDTLIQFFNIFMITLS